VRRCYLFAPLLGWVAVFSLLLPVRAADLPRGDARAAGLSADKLVRIQALLKDAVAARQIAGGSALIARHGKVVYLTTVGFQDAEAELPLREATIFRIASMTKPITSVAVMMLADAGKLRLSDPVSKYLPAFKNPRVLVPRKDPAPGEPPYTLVPAEREITLHDLLAHTSGISYRFAQRPHLGKLYVEAGISDGLTDTPGTIADTVRRLAGLPLWHQPGAGWEYGLSIDVLGRVIEVVAQQTLNDFFQERIFKPLKMADTYFHLPRAKWPRLAALYTLGEDKKIRLVGKEPVQLGSLVFSATYPLREEGTYYSGGGGLVSTIGDYSRFLQMLLNRGELEGVRLLQPETVALMTRSQIGERQLALGNHGDTFGYGFGVVTERGRSTAVASVGSYSWGGAFNTFFWVDPQRELLGVLMTQVNPYNQLKLRDEFQRLTYEALME
jgi:CubicO group peptidase (beta-lactamase class C family)